MSPEHAFQIWAVAHLKADPGVAAIVGDKVLDEAVADIAALEPPYVLIGPINTAEEPARCGASYRIRMRLYACTTESGREDVWTLAQTLRAALRNKRPTLDAPFEAIGPVELGAAGDTIEPERVKSVFLDVNASIVEAS